VLASRQWARLACGDVGMLIPPIETLLAARRSYATD
jgi:hypothetical protein